MMTPSGSPRMNSYETPGEFPNCVARTAAEESKQATLSWIKEG